DGRLSVAKVSPAHRPARPDTPAWSGGRAPLMQCGRSSDAEQAGVSSKRPALLQHILDGAFEQLSSSLSFRSTPIRRSQVRDGPMAGDRPRVQSSRWMYFDVSAGWGDRQIA